MASRVWSFHKAKKQLDQVIDKALTEGPQFISHSDRQVVLIAADEFLKMRAARPSLVEFFRQSPLVGVDLDLTRDRSPIGHVER